MDLLYSIVRERGLTMVCNLHQLDLATTYADRIIGLSSGQVALDEPVTQVSADALGWLYQSNAAQAHAETTQVSIG
jgi:phosphonate transport system ATP-binding protein